MQRIPESLAKQVNVPLLDLKAQYRNLEAEILDALKEVCSRQYFILGEKVTELEREIADYSQCSSAVGVSSGTDALLAALMALEIGPNDEVITTPFTFFATGGVIARLGARPLFCDIEPDTFNLSAATVSAAIADRCEMRGATLVNRRTGGLVKALIPVHLFGQMAEMEPLMEVAERFRLRVVEDAAQAIGSEDGARRRAGSIGDIGCFSFFPSKNLGGLGDGGMCTTSDADLAERLRILRVHGGKPKYHHALIGGNFRLDELQAAALLVKLEHLDRWTAARQDNANRYTQAFDEPGLSQRVTTPALLPGYRHIYNQYVLRVQDRDELRDFLKEAQIGTEIYYPIPLHMQKCFEYLGYRAEDFPVSVQAADEVLAIPVYPELTETQQCHVIDTVRAFYA